MPKKFKSAEERRIYWNNWYEQNKNREDYKAANRETRNRIRKERREWFQEIKKTLKCEQCGNSDFRVLDLHHLDPAQKDTEVSSLVQNGHSKKKILDEIAKCKVLCANCHRIEHYEEKQK
jgi:predicted nucleic-acid-binding Zn-ribbon protein